MHILSKLAYFTTVASRTFLYSLMSKFPRQFSEPYEKVMIGGSILVFSQSCKLLKSIKIVPSPPIVITQSIVLGSFPGFSSNTTGLRSSGGHFWNLIHDYYRKGSGSLLSTQSSAQMYFTKVILFSLCFSKIYLTHEFIDSITSSSSTFFRKNNKFKGCVSSCKLS